MTNPGLSPQLHYVEREIPARLDDGLVVIDTVNLNRHARFIEFFNFLEDALFEGRIAIEAESLVDEPLHGRRPRLHFAQNLHHFV